MQTQSDLNPLASLRLLLWMLGGSARLAAYSRDYLQQIAYSLGWFLLLLPLIVVSLVLIVARVAVLPAVTVLIACGLIWLGLGLNTPPQKLSQRLPKGNGAQIIPFIVLLIGLIGFLFLLNGGQVQPMATGSALPIVPLIGAAVAVLLALIGVGLAGSYGSRGGLDLILVTVWGLAAGLFITWARFSPAQSENVLMRLGEWLLILLPSLIAGALLIFILQFILNGLERFFAGRVAGLSFKEVSAPPPEPILSAPVLNPVELKPAAPVSANLNPSPPVVEGKGSRLGALRANDGLQSRLREGALPVALVWGLLLAIYLAGREGD